MEVVTSELATESAAGQDPRRWRALAVTQLAGFMGLLDVSIVNVALPSIQRDLGASAATVQWVVSGYALAFGLVLVAAGRLGDALGRRRMFMVALVAFVTTSALCGAAPTAGLLVAARLLQGVAAGMLGPQNSGLIQQLFRGAERGRAFGVFGASVGLSTAVGPVAGGLILAVAGEPEGWRWVFLVNVPIGLAALVVAARVLPRSPHHGSGVLSRIDVLGAALLGAGVLCVLLPLIGSSGADGGLARRWWLLPVAAALLATFVWWELRVSRAGREPLLDPVLVTSTPGYPTGLAIGLVYFVGFSGLWLVFAMFFQTGLGYSPLESGLAVTPFALGGAVASAVAGRLVGRFGRWVTVLGLSAVAVGFAAAAVALLVAPTRLAGWAVALPLLVAGLGGGAVISPNVTLTLEAVPVRMAGAAGGALQTGQRIGSAIGTAALAAVFYAVVAGDGGHYVRGAAAALLAAVGFVLVALALAVVELRTRAGRAGRAGAEPTGAELTDP
jgi:EmrB/QacA subfamily drug resistance transporter